MAQGLSNKQPGGVDQTFRWLLHTGGNAVATGAQVADGDGNATALRLYGDRIGITGASGTATLGFNGATPRALTLPDADGELLTADRAKIEAALGITRVKLAADHVNGTADYSAAAGFGFAPGAGGLYHFEMVLLVESDDVNNGVHLRLDGPAGETEFVSYQVFYPEDKTYKAPDRYYVRSEFGVGIPYGEISGAGVPVVCIIKGVLKTKGTVPASDVHVSIKSENNGLTVKLRGGSVMTFTRI